LIKEIDLGWLLVRFKEVKTIRNGMIQRFEIGSKCPQRNSTTKRANIENNNIPLFRVQPTFQIIHLYAIEGIYIGFSLPPLCSGAFQWFGWFGCEEGMVCMVCQWSII